MKKKALWLKKHIFLGFLSFTIISNNFLPFKNNIFHYNIFVFLHWDEIFQREMFQQMSFWLCISQTNDIKRTSVKYFTVKYFTKVSFSHLIQEKTTLCEIFHGEIFDNERDTFCISPPLDRFLSRWFMQIMNYELWQKIKKTTKKYICLLPILSLSIFFSMKIQPSFHNTP